MTRCAACERHEAAALYEVNGFQVVRCRCGLARTELPDGFDPSTIYTEAYFQGGHHDGYADYAGSEVILREEFRGTLAHLPIASGKLLEIGCAYGFFLDEAAARFDVTGVEVADAARAACIARGHRVVRDLSDVTGPFDAAAMLDVIEYLVDPAAALRSLPLRAGAPLVITTGDFGSLVARTMGKRWRLMTPPQHLWFFSTETLTALLAKCGFRVEKIDHPWKRVPLGLVAYQASRYVRAQAIVKRVPVPGRLPVNLFDAMRVLAIKVGA